MELQALTREEGNPTFLLLVFLGVRQKAEKQNYDRYSKTVSNTGVLRA